MRRSAPATSQRLDVCGQESVGGRGCGAVSREATSRTPWVSTADAWPEPIHPPEIWG